MKMGKIKYRCKYCKGKIGFFRYNIGNKTCTLCEDAKRRLYYEQLYKDEYLINKEINAHKQYIIDYGE